MLSKIDDRILITRLKKAIFNSWYLAKDINIFPGPLPVSLERKDFHKLSRYGYHISLKTDGIRNMMLSYEGKIFLVDRNYTFYSLCTTNKLFNLEPYLKSYDKNLEFLIDGELLINGESYNYIIHDLITYRNLEDEWYYSSKNFTERYNACRNLMTYLNNKETIFNISLKQFYPLGEIKKVFELMKTNNENGIKADGIIFMPESKPIGTQTQFNLYKWKEVHTFDFVIYVENGSYVFYATGDSIGMPNVCFGDMKISCPEGQEFKNELEKNCPGFASGNIVECTCNETAIKYYPKMIRKDKMYPNSLKNIQKTINNVKENISCEELIKLFGN